MKTAALFAGLSVVTYLGRQVYRAWRWWGDNVPSHNCEEIT